MAIYRLIGEKLQPFRPKTAATGLYEREVEDLVWRFPEEVIGEPLFLVARQAPPVLRDEHDTRPRIQNLQLPGLTELSPSFEEVAPVCIHAHDPRSSS